MKKDDQNARIVVNRNNRFSRYNCQTEQVEIGDFVPSAATASAYAVGASAATLGAAGLFFATLKCALQGPCFIQFIGPLLSAGAGFVGAGIGGVAGGTAGAAAGGTAALVTDVLCFGPRTCATTKVCMGSNPYSKQMDEIVPNGPSSSSAQPTSKSMNNS